ncbi:MAG: DUF4065 domain-containing protein [Salinisphaera sp.]|jgi:uncharacterized phage-associated protein|nr:DUF4065 domain-containing protein [Salinisphaera sp.]
MYSAAQIANYFLCLSDDEAGDLLTNLKLQKLLYYAQGVTLAITGLPLFDERIKAWEHGPVVPQVWHEFRDYGGGPIPIPVDFDVEAIDEKDREILDEVYDVYGQFSAWKLRNMTHAEAPWLNADRNDEISHGSMRSYFETQLDS